MVTVSPKRFPEYPPVKLLVELPHWMNRDDFCERAAIMEYDGKMSRLDAEKAARSDLYKQKVISQIEANQDNNSFINQEKPNERPHQTLALQ